MFQGQPNINSKIIIWIMLKTQHSKGCLVEEAALHVNDEFRCRKRAIENIKGKSNVEKKDVHHNSEWYECIKLYKTCTEKSETHSNQAVEHAWRFVLF